jgi:endonuclease III
VGDVLRQAAVVCDTHCIRITNLLGLTSSKDPLKCERELRDCLPMEEANDFCHRLVLHGGRCAWQAAPMPRLRHEPVLQVWAETKEKKEAFFARNLPPLSVGAAAVLAL